MMARYQFSHKLRITSKNMPKILIKLYKYELNQLLLDHIVI